MILDRKDATIDICLTDEDDDVLNEVRSISALTEREFTLAWQIAINATHLAYTLDSGAVGVLDLQSHERTIMKTSHTNVRGWTQSPRGCVLTCICSYVRTYHLFPIDLAKVCLCITLHINKYANSVATVVTGGYDSALLHFDFHLKSLLSSLQISPFTFRVSFNA